MDRRGFHRSAAQGVAAAACGGLLWTALLKPQAQAAAPLRPPGAGEDFLARCIRCGQCVKACPYATLQLERGGAAAGAGLPAFAPRQEPCRMCEDLPCVRACPSAALDPALTDVKRARMGLAVIDEAACLSWQGLRCEVCFRVCPVSGQAITLTTQPRQTSRHAMFVPVVHAEACTGCGLCEARCPTEVAAIRVQDPTRVAGRIGSHYRLQGEAEDARPAAPAAAPGPAAQDWLNQPTKP